MTVTTTVDDGLATITLARAKAHNALDVTTKVDFLNAVTAVAENPAVRAVLILAEGKNFCVGQDLGEHVAALDADPSTAMSTVDEHYNPLIRALSSVRVPVVTGIRGACVGAGFGIALAADIRVVGERTSFGTAFTGIGLAADSGLSHTLVAAVGPSRATALLLLGDKIDAQQAAAWGLAHRVVADDEVDSTARDIARRLAQGPTLAYEQVKALVAASSAGLRDALDRESAAQLALGATVDHKAAVAAFLAKQAPTFTGH
ncbi:enoyl-CoA hydratase/isomerase family protein [Gordonia sp. 852002-50395_SCH5434458]|uniref:enoyl-CoA hydratase/isomerase family protein n=1 Tax=Gordonia sp. 852002-50395_SCH5434458 TaxID=1834090 RepID=UPI0007F93F6F|nr:enoyl-CoA hydratase-related protein [Gordonia sp. 852002-50395_SCH5434458]OBB99580.1 enoyl-CoA hydratase [Gordonia sp. 852002-50395_SCH5434458]